MMDARDRPSPDSAHWPFESAPRPVTGMSADYETGHCIGMHSHRRAQLLYAIQGVMVVEAAAGRWVVPPTRAVWIPPHERHSVRMRGPVRMKTVFIDSDAVPGLPAHHCVLEVRPLLRELILAAAQAPLCYEMDSRESRVGRLLLDELQASPVLPLHLPWPSERRLRQVCEEITAKPDGTTTANEWAIALGMSEKTFHRQFFRHTGVTFGRWREHARLLLSLEALAMGEKILHVALRHGYRSQSAYASAFRKHFGVPPSHYHR